jgi:hypothetical protein
MRQLNKKRVVGLAGAARIVYAVAGLPGFFQVRYNCFAICFLCAFAYVAYHLMIFERCSGFQLMAARRAIIFTFLLRLLSPSVQNIPVQP